MTFLVVFFFLRPRNVECYLRVLVLIIKTPNANGPVYNDLFLKQRNIFLPQPLLFRTATSEQSSGSHMQMLKHS